MKIVHVSHLYHPSSGGVQFFFKNVSERLVRDYGDEVTIVTTNSYFGPERKNFKKVEQAQETINGVRIVRFPYERRHIHLCLVIFKVLRKLSIKIPESWMLLANGPVSKPMKRYLLSVDADAFCGSSSNYYYMQLPLWKSCNFFYYGSIHLPENETEKFLTKKQLSSINASTLYLANTKYEKQRLIEAGVRQHKVFVLGTGVDMEPFISVQQSDVARYKQELNIPADGLVIGYVGRIERTKNVQLLLKAFHQIAEERNEVYLIIAGAGSDHFEELRLFASSFPVTVCDKIRWLINFPGEQKAVLFNMINILVLPSHNESFGLVFLEAWSCKKPVVGVSIGAVRDVISDGVDGLLMEKDNVNSLSDKLGALINDDQLRRNLGEKGFNKVKENYTWDIIVGRLRQCYLKGAAQPAATNV